MRQAVRNEIAAYAASKYSEGDDMTNDAKQLGSYTPGPWLVTGHRVHTPVDTLDTCVAVCAGDTFDAPSYDECLANACLIAAAPELLAALRHMVAVLTEAGLTECPECEAARAVIAKAEGREP
jgi:hypothetical protein